MVISLNTDFKTIRVLEGINLEKFFVELEALLPSDEWKQYYLTFEHPTEIPLTQFGGSGLNHTGYNPYLATVSVSNGLATETSKGNY